MWLTGESYAGKYIPYIANELLRHSQAENKKTGINYQGFAINDPSFANLQFLEQLPTLDFAKYYQQTLGLNQSTIANLQQMASDNGVAGSSHILAGAIATQAAATRRLPLVATQLGHGTGATRLSLGSFRPREFVDTAALVPVPEVTWKRGGIVSFGACAGKPATRQGEESLTSVERLAANATPVRGLGGRRGRGLGNAVVLRRVVRSRRAHYVQRGSRFFS